MKTIRILALLSLSAALLCGCDDFLDITPTGKVIAKTGKEYRALLTYEYKNFPEDRGLATLRSDELLLSSSVTSSDDYNSYFDIWAWNDLNRQSTTSSFSWRRYYHTIYIANYLIEHQNEISDAKASEVNQLVGEAYMLRAYCHFLLANLFAEPYTRCTPSATRGIPLSLKADVNAVLRCSSLKAVYDQVLADIQAAQTYLNVDVWDAGYNYRFGRVAADALLARVYLYKGDWQNALFAAKAVLAEHGDLEDLTQSSALMPNSYKSVESILALEKVMTAGYSRIGNPSSTFVNTLYRDGDQRKRKYFKQVTLKSFNLRKGINESEDYVCSMRTGEAYLTAAEAAAQLDSLEAARTWLKTLMQKRYSASTYETYAAELDLMDQGQLLEAIYDERTRELAFEGHRWFDLRRTTQPELVKTYGSDTYTLSQGDARYTLNFPTEAVEANPDIELWEDDAK
jgi:starch-binding outer membrane protein, SusD/RagB family